MPNILDPDFDELREQPGFDCRRARVGTQAGASRLGASVWDVPPGQAACPYHFHLAEEELLFVLAGRPSLRTPGGWRELEPGDTVAFAVGEEGAHQVANRSDADVRVLIVSLAGIPEICIYPDSDKVGVFGRGVAGLRELYRRSDQVDYYAGETAPGS